jgi:hypothetical protein
MAKDYANGYASIVKYDKNDDGTLMVYGNATDDTLDLDSQICDPAWLDSAMPAWFKSGGNVREMHGPSAAGVAKEYEVKSGQHFIGVHVVDPIAVKKVEARVYQGFSIGIKNPRVVRDTKAANGRIIDGSIIEVSLVDRPANPSAKLILAKSVEGESTLMQVEELHEYKAPSPSEIFKHGDHDQSDHNPNAGGGSSSSESSSGGSRDNQVANNEVRNADETRVGLNNASEFLRDIDDDKAQDAADALREAANAMDNAIGELQDAQDEKSDGSHAARIEDAIREMEQASALIDRAGESLQESTYEGEPSSEFDVDELGDYSMEIEETVDALEAYLDDFYGRGDEKSATTKTSKGSKMKRIDRIKVLAKSLTADQILELTNSFAEILKSLDMPMNGESKAVPSRDEMIERYAAARKALDDITMECKANGYEDIEKEYGETAEQETAEGPAVAAETAEEEVEEAREQKPADEAKAVDAEEESEEDKKKKKVSKDDEKESEEDEAMKSLVDRAVKSAMELVRAEIDTLRAEKESAVEKSVKLETELTTALSKTVAGGPKRTATTYGAESNEYLVKALTYKAKADATTDPVLQKGYRDLHEEFMAKANPAQNK